MKVLELTNTESSNANGNEEDITGLSLHVGVNTQASIQFLKTKPSFIVRLIVITIVVTIVDVWLEEELLGLGQVQGHGKNEFIIAQYLHEIHRPECDIDL